MKIFKNQRIDLQIVAKSITNNSAENEPLWGFRQPNNDIVIPSKPLIDDEGERYVVKSYATSDNNLIITAYFEGMIPQDAIDIIERYENTPYN